QQTLAGDFELRVTVANDCGPLPTTLSGGDRRFESRTGHPKFNLKPPRRGRFLVPIGTHCTNQVTGRQRCTSAAIPLSASNAVADGRRWRLGHGCAGTTTCWTPPRGSTAPARTALWMAMGCSDHPPNLLSLTTDREGSLVYGPAASGVSRRLLQGSERARRDR